MFKLHTAYNNITEVNKNRCGSYLTQYNNNNGCADKSSALKVTLFLLFYTKKKHKIHSDALIFCFFKVRFFIRRLFL